MSEDVPDRNVYPRTVVIDAKHDRTCAWKNCHKQFRCLRADQVYCSKKCGLAAWQELHPYVKDLAHIKPEYRGLYGGKVRLFSKKDVVEDPGHEMTMKEVLACLERAEKEEVKDGQHQGQEERKGSDGVQPKDRAV